jgi:4-amino-4-deoxy-L-arabinose transferase-like glycosyltransferase
MAETKTKAVDYYERLMAAATQHEKLTLLLIFLLAFLIRSVFVSLFFGWDRPPAYDEMVFDLLAIHIVRGEGYHVGFGPTASRLPLYPFFVTGIYSLFGPSNFIVVRLLQALLDSLSCVLLYLLGKALGGKSVGLLAAIGAVFYPLSIIMSAQLYTETLFLLLLTATLIVSVKMIKGGQVWSAISGGALFGLSVLTRSQIAALLPFILVYLFLNTNPTKGFAINACIFLFATTLVILPWTVRNYLVFDEFVPLGTATGGAFWAGNNPLANGGSTIPTKETWQGDDCPDRLWIGWSSLGETESSRKFLQTSLHWIRTHPSDFLTLIPKKLARLWSPASFTTHSDRRANPLTKLLWGPFIPFLLLVMVGIAVSLSRWRRWFMLYSIILLTNFNTMIFFGGTRYSMPMVPALLIFSAMGILTVLSKVASTPFELDKEIR